MKWGGDVAMEWHHRDPATKLFHIGNGSYPHSEAKLRSELAKCDLLCSSHHKHTHLQMGGHRANGPAPDTEV